MILLNVNELDKRLWSPEYLAKAAPTVLAFQPVRREPWRDVLRDRRPVLIRLLIANSIYGLFMFAFGISFIFVLESIIVNKSFKYLWVMLISVLLIYSALGYLKDSCKLFFYLFISKRRIEDALEAETRNAR
jgi:ABC-type bacteriocin/lantibiotic exporter with double-glycine peptidase domain